jgi:hypothetical protein
MMIPPIAHGRRPGGAVDHSIYRKSRLIAIIQRPLAGLSASRIAPEKQPFPE